MPKVPEVKIVKILPNGKVVFEYTEEFVEFVKKQKNVETVTEKDIQEFLVDAITQKVNKLKKEQY